MSKLPALTALSTPALDDLIYTVDVSDTTDDTSGSSRSLTHERFIANLLPSICQGRLTTQSGVAVSNGDRAAQSTLYFTPFNGNRIALYDGTRWGLWAFTERSLALSGLTSGRNYDVFLYNNAGTLTLELSAAWTGNGQVITGATNASPIVITANSHGLANGNQVYISVVGGNTAANGTWIVANATINTFELSGSTGNGAYASGSGWFNARSELLTTQDGVLVKSGATTRRYLGTIRASGATTTEDSATTRLVWNNQNQVLRSLLRTDSASHTYATGTVREWNAGTASRANCVIGMPQSVAFTHCVRVTSGSNYVAYPAVNGVNSGVFIQIQAANVTGLGQGAGYMMPGLNFLCVLEAAFGGSATVDTGGVQTNILC